MKEIVFRIVYCDVDFIIMNHSHIVYHVDIWTQVLCKINENLATVTKNCSIL
jgi:hypothetical protein